jgi:hypothetical protein
MWLQMGSAFFKTAARGKEPYNSGHHSLNHTNGCVPSPSTFRKHERRLGRVYSKSLLMQGTQKLHILPLMSSILFIACLCFHHLGLDYYNSGAPYHMYRRLLHKHTIINDCDHLSIANAQGPILCSFFGWANFIHLLGVIIMLSYANATPIPSDHQLHFKSKVLQRYDGRNSIDGILCD